MGKESLTVSISFVPGVTLGIFLNSPDSQNNATLWEYCSPRDNDPMC